MLKKLKYKIWKRLTKSLVPEGHAKDAVLRATYESFKLKRQPKAAHVIASASEPQPAVKATPVAEEIKAAACEVEEVAVPSRIIAVQGVFYSGSSVLVGIFQEFDNIRVVGFPEPMWTKSGGQGGQASECKFFTASGFLEMVQAFKIEPPEVTSSRIRKFISSVNQAYTNKCVAPYENLPDLYNDTFKEITQDLLFKILDLDDHTREFMQNRLFPFGTLENGDTTFSSCNFMKGEGKKSYVFYRFADIPEETFHRYIAEYLEKFLAILGGGDYIVYDQFLPNKYMEALNRYLRAPIKQIVVVRDPRDQFLSANRKDIMSFPRTARGFRDFILRKLNGFPLNSPNRLFLRFEDLVLNYEATRQRVMKFIGLKPENHVAPKTVFAPAISVANIGAWRSYHRQEFMQEIEKELGEYCFYPEREKLSAEAIELLKSSGNWDDMIEILKKLNA